MQVIRVWGSEILHLLLDNCSRICGYYKNLGCGKCLSGKTTVIE